jgi:hypothetical protein
MSTNSLSDIKDSLSGNVGKNCHVQIEDYRPTSRLTRISGIEITRKLSVGLVSQRALMTLHPIRGQ